MDAVIQLCQEGYYTNLITVLLAVFGFTLPSLIKNWDRNLKPLRIYFGGYALMKIIFFISAFFLNQGDKLNALVKLVSHHSDFLFTIFEFYAFAYYLKHEINNNIFVATSTIFGILSFILYAITISKDGADLSSLFLLFIFQASLLLIICVAYFANIFLVRPTLILVTKPSFWVATGVTFFVLSTLPFSLILEHLHDKHVELFRTLFSIFYVFYILLFTMIIRAFFCREQTLTKNISEST